MIPADKSELVGAWLAWDAERRVRRSFAAVRVRGLAQLRAELERAPLLVVSNHTSWWDPLLLQLLCVRVLRADAYAVMDAKNLRRLPFFAKVGAFGVDLDDPADGARAVRYGAKLLDRPGRLVWVFPQGRETPTDAPLELRGGAAAMARVAKRARVVPAALRYEVAGDARPHAWVSFGRALSATHVEAQRDAIEGELARVARAVHAASSGGSVPVDFEELHREGDGWLFALAQRALAFLTRRALSR